VKRHPSLQNQVLTLNLYNRGSQVRGKAGVVERSSAAHSKGVKGERGSERPSTVNFG